MRQKTNWDGVQKNLTIRKCIYKDDNNINSNNNDRDSNNDNLN